MNFRLNVDLTKYIFKALKNQLKTLPKTLSKQTGIGKFTYSQAVRVAAWTRQGMEVPGLSKRDVKELNEFVSNDDKLNMFTNELIVIQKGKQYPKPTKDWLGGNITTDIIGDINKVKRKKKCKDCHCQCHCSAEFHLHHWDGDVCTCEDCICTKKLKKK